jgi:hypothetical protein
MSNIFFARGGRYNEIRFSNINRIILMRCNGQTKQILGYRKTPVNRDLRGFLFRINPGKFRILIFPHPGEITIKTFKLYFAVFVKVVELYKIYS